MNIIVNHEWMQELVDPCPPDAISSAAAALKNLDF